MQILPQLVVGLGLSLAASLPAQTFRISSSPTLDESRPDVAYDLTHDVYLVVWQRTISADESHIMAQRVDPTGNLVGAGITVYQSPRGSRKPFRRR